MRTKKTIFILFSVFVCILISSCRHIQLREGSVDNRRLIVFYSPSCRECVEIKDKIMPDIEKEFAGIIRTEYRDTSDVENYELLLSLKETYNDKMALTLPIIYFEGQLFHARPEPKNIKRIIVRGLGGSYQRGTLAKIDLMERLKNFRSIGIIAAGLGDGINPCAFTVIVFFISFLAVQGYRKREMIAIGFSFILAVFLTYILIGLGLFNVIYSLDKFLLVRKVFNISIGAFSIILGALSYYDLVTFKKTKDTRGLILQLPERVKKRIYAIIGWHYRKPKEQRGRVSKPHVFRLIISALVTGFLVSFLELVCTGQLYLPTIKFALKMTPLKLQALGYLLLYNLMFIAPLLIIFILALLGVTSEQFSKVLRKHIVTLKALMMILFFSLGIALIWRP